MSSESSTPPIPEELAQKSTNITNIVRGLLDHISLPAEISVVQPLLPSFGQLVCHIRVAENSSLLIGQRGLNLEALQTLSRLIARRQLDGWADFSIDVNEYRTSRASALIEEVRKIEHRVSENRTPFTLRPMTSFERKLIHTLLANSSQVKTESTGFGENRRVIIAPKEG